MVALHRLFQVQRSVAQPKGGVSQELWAALKQALLADNGREYFRTYVKDSVWSPPLRGFVLSVLSGRIGRKILLAMSDTLTAEVTVLIAPDAADTKATVGNEVEFVVAAVGFVKSPFMLTVELVELRVLRVLR